MTVGVGRDSPARAKANHWTRCFAWLSIPILLVPLSLSPGQNPPTSISIYQAALADLATVPKQYTAYTRYLRLSHISQAARLLAWWQTLSFHCNQLSTEPIIVPPVVVPNTGGTLIRLNIYDYGPLWTKVYEALTTDPYDHVTVKVQDTKGGEKFLDGETWRQHVDGGWKRYDAKNQLWMPDPKYKGAEKSVRALIAWTEEEKQQLAILVQHTGSAVPILRGDWFLNATEIQFNRSPHGYYDWLGIKDEKTFEELIGFDEKILKRFPKEFREAVGTSGVANFPRAIDGRAAAGGPYYRTDDFEISKDNTNPLRVADRKNIKPTAHENIGVLPNGMTCWGAFEAKTGARQDSAPDLVGFDKTSRSNDGKIHVGRSCVRCHMPSGGINDIDPWFRGIVAKGGPPLQSPDPDVYKELKRLYQFDFAEMIEDSRRICGRSVFKATGLTPEKLAVVYSDASWEYEQDVTPLKAAEELGIGATDMQTRFRDYLTKTGSLDPVLAALMVGKNVSRVSWEEAYVLAQLAVRGLVLADIQRFIVEVKR